MRDDHAFRLGIDLGGTKTEAIVLDAAGRACFRRRVPTPQDRYDDTLATIVDLVRQAEAAVGARASIGIGTPGALSLATGRIKNANSTCLNDRALREDLEAELRRPVRIANDANCFALSEAVDGAGVGAAVVFGVILGTGVGGGIVVDGKIVVGANAIAGEWGHNRLPVIAADELPGPVCYCGRSGCVETYLSGPGFARDFFERSGRALPPPQIAAGALAGDADCRAALDRYEARLARALANVINILDPDVVVLGGGMSNIDELYVRVPELWQPHVFSDAIRTRLARNRHGDSSGVRGAAWLWPVEKEEGAQR